MDNNQEEAAMLVEEGRGGDVTEVAMHHLMKQVKENVERLPP